MFREQKEPFSWVVSGCSHDTFLYVVESVAFQEVFDSLHGDDDEGVVGEQVHPPGCFGDVDAGWFPAFAPWVLVGFYDHSAVAVAVPFHFERPVV